MTHSKSFRESLRTYLRLLAYLGRYRFRMVWALLLMVLSAASTAYLTYLLKPLMDGTFGVSGLSDQHPYQGGLAGFAKTAAKEWPDVVCRALDIDADWHDNPGIAKDVVAELLQPRPDEPAEIGLQREMEKPQLKPNNWP